MSGELITVEVENTTDAKIGRAGKIFLPKTTRTAKISIYGLAEIRACKGLIIHQPEGTTEDTTHTENPDEENDEHLKASSDFSDFSCEQCGFVGKSAQALRVHRVKAKH